MEELARLMQQGVLHGGLHLFRPHGVNGPKLLEALNSDDDAAQMTALTHLCDALNMSNPALLNVITANTFVPPILRCLNKHSNPELMLLAARTLTYMLDPIPDTFATLLENDNIKALLQHLRVIEDVELSDQCLTCVNKVCQLYPGALCAFRADGVAALLSFVDFFMISSQRKVWTAVARMCKGVDEGTFSLVRDQLPLICAAANSSDGEIRYQAMYALLRILFGVSDDAACVAHIFDSLVGTLLQIVVKADVADRTFAEALEFMITAATFGRGVVRQMIESGLVAALQGLLELVTAQSLADQSALTAGEVMALPPPASDAAAQPGSPNAALASPSTSPRLGPAISPDFTATRRQQMSEQQIRQLCGLFATLLVACHDAPLTGLQNLVILERLHAQQMPTPTSPDYDNNNNDDEDDGEDETGNNTYDDDDDGDDDDDEDDDEDNGEDEEETVANNNNNNNHHHHRASNEGNDGTNAERPTSAQQSRSRRASSRPARAEERRTEEGTTRSAGNGDDGENEDGGGEYNEDMYADDEDERRAAQLRADIARTVNLRLKLQYTACNVGAHTCNRCGCRCMPGNWYRCNQCSDFDLCAPCILAYSHRHHNDMHSFTDMQLVFSPAGRVVSAELEEAKAATYSAHPDLLATVLAVLPRMLRISLEVETLDTRRSCFAFIASALAAATPAQLEACGLREAPLSAAIVSALADPTLSLNLYGIHITQSVLARLPTIYRDTLTREGVAHALQELHLRHSPRRGTPAAMTTTGDTERTGETRAAMNTQPGPTLSTWRVVVAQAASTLLPRFPSLQDELRLQQLQQICSLLQTDRLKEAFTRLRDTLCAGVTPFELQSSDLVPELRAALARHDGDDVEGVMDLIDSLSFLDCRDDDGETGREGAASNCRNALLNLVRHLQTMLLQHAHFRIRPADLMSNIQGRLTFRLAPHPGSVAERTANDHDEDSDESRGGSEEERNGSSARRQSAPSATVPPQRGGTLVVAVDSMAPIGTICDFINTHLLQPEGTTNSGSSGSGRDYGGLASRFSAATNSNTTTLTAGDGEEGSPSSTSPLNDSDRDVGSPAAEDEQRARAVHAGRDPAALHLRCGRYVLPASLTVLQLVQFLRRQEGRRGVPRISASFLPRRHHHQRRGGEADSRRGAAAGRAKAAETVTLHYSEVPFGPRYATLALYDHLPIGAANEPVRVLLPSHDARPPAVLQVMERLHFDFPCSRRFLNTTQRDLLVLLGTLHAAMLDWPALLQHRLAKTQHGKSPAPGSTDLDAVPSVSLSEFVNTKLDNKAMQQCSNLLLAGQHSRTWAVALALDCNFLFSVATRQYLFGVSFCGTLRSLVRMQQMLDVYGMRDRAGATNRGEFCLLRVKKRVRRSHVLRSALALFRHARASESAVWEYEFYGEVGSGPGPAREFYSLVAQALQRRSLGLWRGSDEPSELAYYTPLNGLYPAPHAPDSAAAERLVAYFHFIGLFIARTILDDHIPALPLSPVLLKMLRGDACTLYDVQSISEQLGQTLIAMLCAHQAHSETLCLQSATGQQSFTVEELSLDFTAPGDDPVPLRPDGAATAVTRANMLEYCDAVTGFLLRDGVAEAVRALREGFNELIPLCALRILSITELQAILTGHERPVTQEEFEANCLADHGYTLGCRHMQWLFEILSSFDVEEQRRFFTFLTGSPRLPVGGLASLRPKMTVVRKTSTDPDVKDTDELPSAMTCQNYLKLPAYGSKELMEAKLRKAIDEGRGAFMLT